MRRTTSLQLPPSLTAMTLIIMGLLMASGAVAGPNPDFVASVDAPIRLENPTAGQEIALQVRAANTVEIKGIVIRALFDPAVVEFVSYSVGDVTPGALALPKSPEVRADGLAEVEGGSTILGAGLTSTTSGGLLGVFRFRMLDALPDAGSGIWLLSVEVNTSADPDDEDVLTYAAGELGVTLARRFPNRAFNAEVTRRFDGATVAWETRFVGLADTLRVRATGDSLWRVVAGTTAASFSADVVQAAQTLLAAGVALGDSNTTARDAALESVGLGPPYAEGFLTSLARLNRLLLTRRHVVSVDSLAADRQYEYSARSTGLAGARTNALTGLFRTRLAPDLRPVAGTDLDVQTTTTTASASWYTNRLADTQLQINDLAGNEIAALRLDPEGALSHSATIDNLLPNTQYAYVVTSRLVDADALVAQGLLTEAQITVVKTGTFRTRAARQPLRLLAPPARVVSPETAVINFRLNQIALATIAYGEIAAANADSASTELYEFSTSTGDILNEHSITLTDLTPATQYRYRVSVVTPDGDSLSTDPAGNQQWSRDLMFTTSAAGDTLPPVIIEGPDVVVRDVLAVVRFTTDVDTRATVFFGTRNGTYGTADEFEIADQTTDGSQRLSQRHAITVSGLEPGAVYDYGIVVEATNGQTASFEPNLPAGKRARAGKRLKVLQPPGGAGSFTTNNNPDTQYPVILSGPSVSSKTNRTAIIEWTTDEPATSAVDFGLQAVNEAQSASGVARTRHKIVLSNLVAGTGYAFQVGSTDAAGNGATMSSQGTFATDPDVDLTAPVLLDGPAVIYKNNEVATIRWTTDEDATAQVEFGTSTDQLGFIRSLPSTGSVHEITLTNLLPSTTYYYRVSSSDLSNNGPTQSDVVSLTTDATADAIPPVIDSVVVTAADSSAIVSWTTDELADSFVDLGTVSGLLGTTVGDAADVLQHEVTLTNLLPGTQYFLTVGSSDRSGNGPTESAEMSFTTLSAADTTAPAAPAGLAATPGNKTAVLAWNAGAEGDLAGYNVYRRRAGEDPFVAIATLVATPKYTDLAVQNDTAFEYRVTALDRTSPANESVASAVTTVTPTLAAAPTVPTGLRVDGQALQPTLSFTNAEPFSAGSALTYTIQVSTQADFSDVTASKSGVASGSGSTSWTLTRLLADGTTYYWRVRAAEGTLLGPFSATHEFLARTRRLLAGDFNDSGAVDFDDFFAFVDAFGKSADEFPAFDLNGSGPGTFIDFDDFFAFVDAFGTTAGKSAGNMPAVRQVHESARLQLVLQSGLNGPNIESGSGDLARDVVRLQVQAEGITDVRAFGLTLTWDPEVLSFATASGAPASAGLFQVLDERPGRLMLGDTRDGAPAGLLADLTFHLRDARLANDARIELAQGLLASTDGLVRSAPQVVAASVRPTALSLSPAWPNPFNPSTQISFSLPAATSAQLVVFDILGRTVRTLVPNGMTPAGFYTVRWDGRDTAGRAVGNGVYFYRLTTSDQVRTGRMLLLK